MAVTFVAPHSLHARPLVVPRGRDVVVWNRTPDVDVRGPRRRPPRRRPPAGRAVVGGDSAPTARCSRRSPRRPSCRRYRQRPVCFVGCAIENLVLIREAELELAPGPERAHRRDRRREDDLRAGDRPAARRQGRRGGRRAGGERGVRRGRARRPGRRSSRTTTLAALAELRPEDEAGLVLARRVFADGRTRAYAWGRAVAREDLAAAAERLIAMSGQFEQRRLARPSFQLDVLDALRGRGAARPVGRRRARRGVRSPRPAVAHDELARDADAAARPARASCRRSSRTPTGSSRATRTSCAPSASAAPRRGARRGRRATRCAALDPEDGRGRDRAGGRRGARARTARAPRTRARGSRRRAPGRGGAARRGGSELHGFLASLRRRPGARRGGRGEARPDRRSRARRHGAADARRAARPARRRGGRARRDTPTAATRSTSPARSSPPPSDGSRTSPMALRTARRAAAPGFAEAVGAELRDVGMGEGEFAGRAARARPRPERASTRPCSSSGRTPGCRSPRSPRRRRAASSRASRSRSRWSPEGETLVFDEIDAGIGGVTAHVVADDAAAARRPGTGADDHAPAADRERRRPPLPGREAPRRPDAHADRVARRRRSP